MREIFQMKEALHIESPDYIAMLRVLNKHGVDYLIIGGHAFSFYAQWRYTKDFDVWIRQTAENAQHAYDACSEFGAPMDKFAPADFANDLILQIGVEPFRIDILKKISGVDFDSAWRQRVIAKLGDLEIPFISKQDLIASKLAAGRRRDLADVEDLEESGTASK